MTQETKEKVLITLDGSQKSLKTVAYASKLKPLKHMEITLFHVFDAIPENFWDLKQDGRISGSLDQLNTWETHRKKVIDEHMHQAHQILMRSGFKAMQVHIVVQPRKEGIARDIIVEAKKGYKALITRRRGMGAIRSLVIGSVTSKLLDSLQSIPILLAGQKPFGKKILVGVDGSRTAEKALDFVANFLGGYGYHIGLVHVIRGKVDFIAGAMPMPIYTPEPFLMESMEESKNILNEARDRLLAAGFEGNQITCRTIAGAASRAASIAEEAETGDYNTIILGRRGLSGVQEFLMGRVTKKVIHLARRYSIWIVT